MDNLLDKIIDRIAYFLGIMFNRLTMAITFLKSLILEILGKPEYESVV